MMVPRPSTIEYVRGPLDLHQVVATGLLAERRPKPRKFAAENDALMGLARTMSQRPSDILQNLVDEARSLTGADSAGISLLEPALGPQGEQVFRWAATSGDLGPLVGAVLPRAFSPCGTVLDQDRMLLLADPARHYAYIGDLPFPIREVLLSPFYLNRRAEGTVWLVSHTDQCTFDREDARTLQGLSEFASIAMQVLNGIRSEQHARSLAEDALASIQEANRAAHENRANFLATLAHELRNGLAPFSYALDLIRLSPDRAVRTNAREILERQLTNVTRLVGDLLDAARVNSGKMAMKTDPLDVCRVVSLAVEASRGSLQAKEQTVSMETPTAPLTILGDEVRLSQVFSNLLSNAAKYCNGPGVVTIEVKRVGDEAAVFIRDTGIGFEPQLASKLFDFFFQADSPDKATGGLGIGLGLVKRLVELHRGRVFATSNGTNSGAEFSVFLPLTKGAEADSAWGDASRSLDSEAEERVFDVKEPARSIEGRHPKAGLGLGS